MASDDDDDDLFADFDNTEECDVVNVSANLIADVGQDKVMQSALGSEDEGKRIQWVAPAVSGLKNSSTVNERVKHWYKDDDFKNKPDKNKRSPGMPGSASVPGNLASMGMPRVQSTPRLHRVCR